MRNWMITKVRAAVSVLFFAFAIGLCGIKAVAATNTTWQDDYSYYLNEDKIIIDQFYGEKDTLYDLEIPAEAVISGNTYKTVIDIGSGRISFFNHDNIRSLSVESGVEAKNLQGFCYGTEPSDDHKPLRNNLIKVDLSNLNTDNLENTDRMFGGCRNLTDLKLGDFNTAKVTSMGAMFQECNSLTALDLGSFSTSNTKYIGDMFSGCSSLQELDLSNFDTSKITSLDYMFEGCSSLKKLDLSSFDTGKVTSMDSMFKGCSSLEELDLSNFDTLNVTNMNRTFTFCYSLEKLDISSWDMRHVTETDYFLNTCRKLKEVKTPICSRNAELPYSMCLKNDDGTIDDNRIYSLEDTYTQVTLVYVPLENVSLSLNEANMNIGDSIELTITCTPSNYSRDSRADVWQFSSDNYSVATVDMNSGEVTLVGRGTTTIKAIYPNIYTSFDSSNNCYNTYYDYTEPKYKAECIVKSIDSVYMYRLYNPNTGEHFYTSSAREVTALVKAGWNDEGLAWVGPSWSNTPVYRLYNENVGEHHYTPSKKERDKLVKLGWKDEGIGWYSDDKKGTPLYRLYNPNATTGNHHYTTSTKERDKLVKIGWNDEGIGWYGYAQ